MGYLFYFQLIADGERGSIHKMSVENIFGHGPRWSFWQKCLRQDG
jgi:hypothetical protein